MAQGEGTGLFQYLKWGTSSATTGTGLVTGGDLTINPQPRKRRGIGGQNIRRGGQIVPSGNAEMYVTKTNFALLNYGMRATYPYGALTSLAIEGGADQWGRAYAGARIEEGGLDYARGEGLKGSVKWGALSVAAASGGAQLTETNLDFEDYEFVIELEGAQFGINALSIKWNNNLEWRAGADTKAAGSLRRPTHHIYGPEDLTVELTADRPFTDATLTLLTDLMASDLGITAVGDNGTDTCTITLVNLIAGENSHGFVDPTTGMTWKQSFVGDDAGSLTLNVA